jgi:competence protein ComEC
VLTREIPFLRIVVPLCLGIICGLYIHPGLSGMFTIIMPGALLIIISFYYNKRLVNITFGASFFCLMFALGLIIYTIEKERLSELKREKTLFTGVITDYPEKKANTFLVPVKLSQAAVVKGSPVPVKGSLLLYLSPDMMLQNIQPGDLILFTCIPNPIINRGNPYEFDYKFYMETRGVKYYGFHGKNDIFEIKSPPARKLKYKALIIRNRIIAMYEERGITGQRLALVSAVTLGEKSQLDKEQKQNFIRAGVMHIMAVSGLHSVILSLFIFNILFFLKGKYTVIRVVLTVLFLWGFAFVTGLTPSVLRATLMFSFLQAGLLLKRPVNPVNSVLASAFALIIIRPSVIFDAGFLLSYSAVIFIIVFYRDLYTLLPKRNRPVDFLWQSASVTTVAQAGTLPLTIMLFNRFPVWFLLSNIIIVPVSSLLIIIGCLVPATYFIVPVSSALARILDRLTWLTEYLTEKAASLPFSSLEGIGLSVTECIFLVLTITLLMAFLLKKPRLSMIIPLGALLLFMISSATSAIRTGRTNEFIVYNVPGETAVGLKTGRIINLYHTGDKIPADVIKHASVLRLKIIDKPLTEKPVFIKAGGKKILITQGSRIATGGYQMADFLVIAGVQPVSSPGLKLPLNENCMIVTEMSPASIKAFSDNYGIMKTMIWPVRESGAFIRRL